MSLFKPSSSVSSLTSTETVEDTLSQSTDAATAVESLQPDAPNGEVSSDQIAQESSVVDLSDDESIKAHNMRKVETELGLEFYTDSDVLIARMSKPTPTVDAVDNKDLETGASSTENLATESLAQTENTITIDNAVTATASVIRVNNSAIAHALLHLDTMGKHDQRVSTLHQGVHDLQMITAFTQVAKDHNLSAPLVSAFRAAPGFDQAIANFPSSSLFDIVAAPTNSALNIQGLESFGAAETQATDDIRNKAQDLSLAYHGVLSDLGTTITGLQTLVKNELIALESSDLTDEVLATLPVTTLSADAFTQTFSKLSDQLRAVDVFDAESFRSHPEAIKQTITDLSTLVNDIGGTLGLTLNGYGLATADKNASFEPTQSDFGQKEITRTGLVHYLNQANDVLDALQAVSGRQEELTTSVSQAVGEMPTAVLSNDVTYGCVEHAILLSSYTTLVTKLVRESIVSVTTLLATVDSALTIDDGLSN